MAARDDDLAHPGLAAIAGLVLAAGAGTRMGSPKALVLDSQTGQSWLLRTIDALSQGGCTSVTVVVGARAHDVMRVLRDAPAEVSIASTPDWQLGVSQSLRAGLKALDSSSALAAAIMLVDLPDVGADVVRRVLEQGDAGVRSLARAAYNGMPGHPVLVGRDHWAGVQRVISGDRGAGGYLRNARADLIECGDLATGVDQDTRP